MNTTITNHASVLRELSEAMGATSFEDHGHVCYFSKNHEWHLYASYGHNPLQYSIGVHIPNEISHDVRTSYHLRQICPASINLSKAKSVEILANAIHRRLFPAAAEFAKAMWQADEEEKNHNAATANSITKAALIIGASPQPNSAMLYGKLGCHSCTANISGTRIDLSISNLSTDKLEKIAAALKE